MEIQFSKAAAKYIHNQDRPTKQRIKLAIDRLPDGDVKPLKGSDGSYRLRVGDLRILFSYPARGIILVEKIGSRGDIYKGV